MESLRLILEHPVPTMFILIVFGWVVETIINAIKKKS